MMVPDSELIAEIILQSEGFTEAKVLAKKITTLYALMIQQLSKQDHYDFGLRAIKSILVKAGALKRANPEEQEKILLLVACRCVHHHHQKLSEVISCGFMVCACTCAACTYAPGFFFVWWHLGFLLSGVICRPHLLPCVSSMVFFGLLHIFLLLPFC